MAGDATAEAQALIERAERLLEQAKDRGARFLIRGLGRAREEAEDIWAEAKSAKSAQRP